MPTSKKRIAIILEDDLRDKVEEYCMTNGLRSLASAVVDLVWAGVEAEKHVERVRVPDSLPVSGQDVMFLSRFRRLPPAARDKVLNFMASIPEIPSSELPRPSDCLDPEANALLLDIVQLGPESLFRIRGLVNAEIALADIEKEKKRGDAVS